MSQAQPPAYENLPTSGAMGTEPALSVGTIMLVVTLIVGFLGASGVYTPSPEVRAWAEQYGLAAATIIVALWQFVQAWLTRNRVISPATMAGLLRRG